MFYNVLSNRDPVGNLLSSLLMALNSLNMLEDEGYCTEKRINWKPSSSFSAEIEIRTTEIRHSF